MIKSVIKPSRVAIGYHRSIRGKKVFVSELESINGIGATRRKRLMEHFKSIDKIKKATVEELTKVQGIDRTSAENVYNYFHS